MARIKAKKIQEKEIARGRIVELFEQAEQVFKKDSKFSDRYAALAKTIAMKFKVRIPPELRRRVCKHCSSYLKQGVNLRVRLQQGKQGKVVYFCMTCEKYMRFPYKSKRPQKAKK